MAERWMPFHKGDLDNFEWVSIPAVFLHLLSVAAAGDVVNLKRRFVMLKPL